MKHIHNQNIFKSLTYYTFLREIAYFHAIKSSRFDLKIRTRYIIQYIFT